MEGLNYISHKKLSSQPQLEHELKRESRIRAKIIRLIRQKKYPLHISNRSNLLFPKIKDKHYKLSEDKTIGLTKKYIQINIDSERRKSGVLLRTDIEEEMIHKYRQNSRKKQVDLIKFEESLKNTLKTLDQNCTRNKSKQLYLQNRYASCHMDSQLQLSNIFTKKYQDTMLQTEEESHSQIMNRIKFQIQRKKNDYIRKVNLTDILDPSKDKENVNLQYIVNELERQKSKSKEVIGFPKISAYQSSSPNQLEIYISLMTDKKEPLKRLWEALEKDQENRQKRLDDEKRSIHLIKTCPDQNTTIVEDESQIKQENILSAKYRLKSNHKRLIAINKVASK